MALQGQHHMDMTFQQAGGYPVDMVGGPSSMGHAGQHVYNPGNQGAFVVHQPGVPDNYGANVRDQIPTPPHPHPRQLSNSTALPPRTPAFRSWIAQRNAQDCCTCTYPTHYSPEHPPSSVIILPHCVGSRGLACGGWVWVWVWARVWMCVGGRALVTPRCVATRSLVSASAFSHNTVGGAGGVLAEGSRVHSHSVISSDTTLYSLVKGRSPLCPCRVNSWFAQPPATQISTPSIQCVFEHSGVVMVASHFNFNFHFGVVVPY